MNTDRTSEINYTNTLDADYGLAMTREIQADPEEVESLRRSRQQAKDGDVQWLTDDETDVDDKPSDHHGWPSSALTGDEDIPQAT